MRLHWKAPRILHLAAAALLLAICAPSVARSDTSLRVMSYNILVGGAAYGPLARTVGVIQTSNADIIGLQEVGGSAPTIAAALGFYHHTFNSDLAIVSRYPITQVLNQGVKLQLSPTQDVYLFDVHLAAYPYQPYDIRDGLITTEAQAISQAQAARNMNSVLNGMSTALNSGSPVFLVGDFNEPSHLDWTQEAAAAGKHFGMKVDWPTSRAVTNAGLIDAYRAVRPDEVADPGDTWTTGYPAPFTDANEIHDRIDFVYYAGGGVTPTLAKTIGYNAADGSTDIAIQPYPSDHRAVFADFTLSTCFALGDINGDCTLNAADWAQFRSGQHVDMTGFTRSEALALGDLNADYKNNHADFVLFKQYFEDANGAGSFLAMLTAVPEPGTAGLCGAALLAVVVAGRRPRHFT